MPSNAIYGSSARRLHQQRSLGLTAAFVQTALVGEVILIQAPSELVGDHSKAEKTYKNYQRLFPGQNIMLWGDQAIANQPAFATADLLVGMIEILSIPLEWIKI